MATASLYKYVHIFDYPYLHKSLQPPIIYSDTSPPPTSPALYPVKSPRGIEPRSPMTRTNPLRPSITRHAHPNPTSHPHLLPIQHANANHIDEYEYYYPFSMPMLVAMTSTSKRGRRSRWIKAVTCERGRSL